MSSPVTEPSAQSGMSDEILEAMTSSSRLRIFAVPAYRRLFTAQVVSSMGDWIGLFALIAMANNLGFPPGVAEGVVLAARLIPGFFFGPVVGVLVDRWDRKRIMVFGDIGRAITLAALPFLGTGFYSVGDAIGFETLDDRMASLVALFSASIVLEVFTLAWAPAKEASVPKLVPAGSLVTANSLSLVAAYGTFPVGALLYSVLVSLGGRIQQTFTGIEFALYFDVLTFLISALLISTLPLVHKKSKKVSSSRMDFGKAFRDLKDGLAFIKSTPRVRAVILGLAVGLMGGGMVVPLGNEFSRTVLKAGDEGFGALLTALGFGVATGVIGLSTFVKRVPPEKTFVLAVMGCGISLFTAALMPNLQLALFFAGVLGLCAGAVYSLGFTILQANVSDELRGRTFATLYTLVRFCLLLSMVGAPFLSAFIDANISQPYFPKDAVEDGFDLWLPGVRITLWLGSVIILGAALVTSRSLRVLGNAKKSE